MKLLLAAAIVLVGAVAWPQPRITSFNSSGELTWTNFAQIGAYRVAWADSPTGSWNPFDALTNLNLILAQTNRVTVQLPLSNAPVFYRAAWMPPEPIGDWDYRGYDSQGTLVITGQLGVVSKTVLSTNPPNPVYGVQGSWNLEYAGPPTNQLWYLGPQTGTGSLGGTLEVGYARFQLGWPTNQSDDAIHLSGTLWPNTYTGWWVHVTWVGPQGGPFSALRIP